MRIFGCLTAALLCVSISFGNEAEAPTSFDKQPFQYTLLAKFIFDIDNMYKDMGVDIVSCRVESVTPKMTFPGSGNCLFQAIGATIKTKQPSVITLWVRNKENPNEILPPLKLEWKHSHISWARYAHEFLHLTFEKFFGALVKKDQKITETPGMVRCRLTNIPNRDLGNFIGNMIIHIPPGRKIHDYFNFKILESIKTETLNLSAKVPYHIDKKRVYQARLNYQNPQLETVDLSIVTDFNLISRRDFCLSGDLNLVPVTRGVIP